MQVGSPTEVYEHPVNPFVYDFLGNVNLFHGRVDAGIPYIGAGATGASGKSAVLYVRPHQLDISHRPDGNNHLQAKIQHINSAGPLVKIELTTSAGESVRVELTQERFRALALERDHEVFVSLKEAQFFAEDYSI